MNPITTVAVAVAALGVLFGGPALVGPIRRAVAQRRADAENARQEAAARKEALTQLWTTDPEAAGVGEALAYQAQARGGLVRQAHEQHRMLGQRDDQVKDREQHIRDGDPVTPGYRLRVLTGLVLFLVVFILGVGLDYLIFRGLHPTGTWLLPFALACLAVIGITAGSVLFLGATRHHLLPAGASAYARRVVALAGAMLAAGITVYMIVIAPYRSAPAGQARINLLQQQLASDRSEILASGGSNSQLLTADRAALAKARTDLAQAQRVDRWSAAVLAVLDIPLSEAGFLGAELLLLDLAVLRRERARQQAQEADDAIQEADDSFTDALHQALTQHGHADADEVIPRLIARVSRLGPGTQSPAIGSLVGSAPGQGYPGPWEFALDGHPDGRGPAAQQSTAR
jgi:hypothetical protein